MKRCLFSALALLMLLAFSCKKEQQVQDTVLTGTWVKGSIYGDTLNFTNNDGKSIMRYNASFNPALPVITEFEYRYISGKLYLKGFMTDRNSYHAIESFNWLQEGEEFEVLGYQLFPIMSSTLTRFRYKKI